MDYLVRTRDMLDFVHRGVSPYHVVAEIKECLKKDNFTELAEYKNWELTPGGHYFVTRNDSSIIAFTLPQTSYTGFQIIASHCDSPTFKIKEKSELSSGTPFVRLNVEKYGGMIYSTWFDRPLSIAGRVVAKTEDGMKTFLYDAERNLVSIPNLAIHFNRDVNDGHKYDLQKELMPILGMGEISLKSLVADDLHVQKQDILDMDLSLYNREEGHIWGADKEFCSSPRLDDAQCVYASLQGFLQSIRNEKDADLSQNSAVRVLAVFDNEEVGSTTKQGAASTFLADTLKRINLGCHRTAEDFYTSVANSFLLSADNAHSVHPNYAEKSDAANYPVINGGVVIKYNANQKYTTDAISGSLCRYLADAVQIPVQSFANHSNSAGGSTLGNISNTQVSLNAVDIGLAQWAMHSSYETAGTKDTEYLVRLSEKFYSETIVREDDSYRIL